MQHRRRLDILAIGACATALACAGVALATADAARVAVVFGAKGPYQSAAHALAAELRASGHECTLFELPEGDESGQEAVLTQVKEYEPTIVATGGAAATSGVLDAVPSVPVVFFMVPNALDAPFMAADFAGRQRVCGVASDIDPAMQVDWIARAQPRAGKTAVLCSPRSARTAAALEEAGRKRSLHLSAIQANRDEFPKAIEALNARECLGVLMIPDAQVYNSPNVQELLLWGVRQKKAVFAFSENVVKAGAFTGLYCDDAAVGRQAAQLVVNVIGGKAPSAVGLQYPQHVGRAVNVHTAEMIGATLNKDVLAADVLRLGGGP